MEQRSTSTRDVVLTEARGDVWSNGACLHHRKRPVLHAPSNPSRTGLGSPPSALQNPTLVDRQNASNQDNN